jgi:hypothetical protein
MVLRKPQNTQDNSFCYLRYSSAGLIVAETENLATSLERVVSPKFTTTYFTVTSIYLLNYLFTYLLTYLLTYFLTYLLTYLLTPWSRVLLENITGSQLVKKFPACYGTRKFIAATATATLF